MSSAIRRQFSAFIAGDPVFLAKNDFYLNYTKERAEGIVFSSVKDGKKKG